MQHSKYCQDLQRFKYALAFSYNQNKTIPRHHLVQNQVGGLSNYNGTTQFHSV